MKKHSDNCTESEQSVSEQEEQTASPGQEAGKEPFKDRAVSYIKGMPKRYFITAFSGMAMGLFCTLIAGTIFAQIGTWIGDNGFGNLLTAIAKIAKMLMGAGIGVGIAYKLNAKPLVVFTAAVTGLVGAFAGDIVSVLTLGKEFTLAFGAPGNPIGAYVVSLLTIELASLYAGRTKLDIVLIPLGMLVMCIIGVFVAWPFIKLIDLLAKLIVLLIEAGAVVKVLTGIVVAIVMGILLTMPTSSAAIWIAIAGSEVGMSNPEVFAIAGGAAVAGCAAHMVGFAVATFRENGWSGLIAQGIGTSMLQIPNIMRKPIIMLPEIAASAISGLVAVLIDLRCNAAGGGMGTSGLVGVFGAIEASVCPAWQLWLGIILCMFVIPAAVSLLISELMRKKGLIGPENLRLDM